MDARDRTLLWAIAFYVCIDALRNITDRLISLWGTM